MDTSYLAQQVNTIVGQLHGLFDEIGVPNHERDAREEELFAALSDALHNQVRLVTAEKKGMVEEAQKMITTIRQMEASLDDGRSRREKDDGDLRITYPLTRCLQVLKEKHIQVGRLHRERYEQVKKLAQALESYSLHLEPTFVQLALPPTGPNQSISASFDLSPAYVDKLDAEFTRVYEEYSRRVATVKALAENMIQLWAELGTPQAQTDGAIVKYYRDAPEQLGLHEEDIVRLRAKRDKLVDEKKNREKRLRDLKSTVEALWEKLGVEERERKAFMNGNRGCGIRQINEFEDELARLNELKRQNLHLFVEDARFKLQELWDALYLSEDEMLEFTPAFSDVYSDALLEAHEREINRLEILKDQRAPTLALVDKHRSLVSERDELAASSLDASRLMMRGQKGERRDPGKLLREEKMRKRIAKELPKVIAELRKALEQWEDEYGRPFLVHGERYLDNLEAEDAKPVPGPRSKTPGPAPTPTNTTASGLNRAKSVGSIKGAPKGLVKTPSLHNPPTKSMHGSIRGAPASFTSTTATTTTTTTTANPRGSPTRIPARMPLSNLKHGGNSPERPPSARPESRLDFPSRPLSAAHNNPVFRAPPPKMRDLALLPAPELETPYRVGPGPATAPLTASIVRHVSPEDPYGGGGGRSNSSGSSADERFPSRPASRDYFSSSRSTTATSASSAGSYPSSSSQQQQQQQQQHQHNTPGLRQISNTSTVITGSENWETYDDNSEPEEDLSEAYFARLRAARAAGKNLGGVTAVGAGPGQMKRLRGVPPPLVPPQQQQQYQGQQQMGEGRVVSAGEWTDEDAF